MKTIRELLKEIDFEIEQERQLKSKGLIKKAQRIKEKKLKVYIESSERKELIDIITVDEYLKIMRPSKRDNLKQTNL